MQEKFEYNQSYVMIGLFLLLAVILYLNRESFGNNTKLTKTQSFSDHCSGLTTNDDKTVTATCKTGKNDKNGIAITKHYTSKKTLKPNVENWINFNISPGIDRILEIK